MITSELLARIFPDTRRALRDRFVAPLNKYCALYGIDSYLRICAFLATGGVETDYLRTTTEYASGADYEGRAGLGNTQKGDGVRFKGRGFFQTTGRFNYRQVTKATISKLGIDFEKQPEKLAEIEIAVESACIFWRDNNLARYADRGDFLGLSGIVNRGSAKKKPLHWSKRNELYQKCRRLVPKDFSMTPKPAIVTVVQPSPMVEPSPAQSPEPVVLTPTEASDDFLSTAFDKTVSADEIRTTVKGSLPSFGARLWRYLARPVLWIYAALEAGNVAAWLGIAVAVAVVIYILYRNRAKIGRFFEKLKAKFTA